MELQVTWFKSAISWTISKLSPTPGLAPNRILQNNDVHTAVRTILHNSDIKALNIGITEIPFLFFFTTRKSIPLEMFWKKLVEIKAAEPCPIGFWKRKCNFTTKTICGCWVTNVHRRLDYECINIVRDLRCFKLHFGVKYCAPAHRQF